MRWQWFELGAWFRSEVLSVAVVIVAGVVAVCAWIV